MMPRRLPRHARPKDSPFRALAVSPHAEHPVDAAISHLAAVRRADTAARRAAAHLHADPAARLDPLAWVRFEDARLLQRVVREEAYFDEGWRTACALGAGAWTGGAAAAGLAGAGATVAGVAPARVRKVKAAILNELRAAGLAREAGGAGVPSLASVAILLDLCSSLLATVTPQDPPRRRRGPTRRSRR